MTRQLALPLSAPPVPTLENFVPGANGELLERLRELAAGRLREAVIYLWGAAGCGRSHLLAASARPGVTLADDVEALDAAGQQGLFNAINRAREDGGTVLAAGAAPPAQLALREDLRSRLGWGLVYEVKPLTDAERAVYLRAEAARRGLRLADEVVWYLLTHVKRDMPSLRALLEQLDRASLEQRRPVTLPLVREALKAFEQ
ncbi:MAG TPA: DnaA/Hda family protein [Burkholderiales bacterium]|nr:DnaA/Hda family protein [Burkholderiales bacterium]